MRYVTLVVMFFALKAYPCDSNGYEPSNCGNEAVDVSTEPQRQIRAFERDLRSGKVAERTNAALNAILTFAAYKLNKRGYKVEADRLLREWDYQWNGEIMQVGRGPGDHSHAPLSQWLREKTDLLTFILGIEVMKMTRLWDLVVINDSIPIVFGCEDDVLEEEFGTYFVPFSGTIVFWVSWGACTGLTWGTGFFFCGPIASGVEFLDTRWLAPKLNPTIWNWSCN